jgi:hypothetical protein
VRFALAVIASAIGQLVPYLRPGVPGALAVAYILFAALGAGFFAGRRAFLAGALSVVLGATLYAIWIRVGPGAAALAPGDFIAVTAFLFGTVPYALLGALAGAAGGMLRSRVVPGAR